MKNLAINTSDERLTQRYCQLHGIVNWKDFPRQKIGAFAFEMVQFWRHRADFLKVESVDALLELTPIEGAHTLERPAFLRSQG